MSAELNCHIETLLCAAIEINDAAELEVFLDRACGTDDELREQVSRLVQTISVPGDSSTFRFLPSTKRWHCQLLRKPAVA